jgi:hypothetical protein
MDGMADLQLREMIRNTIKRRKRAQPNDIATSVATNTPNHLLRPYLEEALRPVVADIMREQRNHAILTMRKNRRILGNGPVSANVEAIRNVDWQRIFSEQVATATGWKQVGDCTADDLDFCGAARRRDAELVIAQAEFYEDLAQRVRKHNVATPRDLQPKDLP